MIVLESVYRSISGKPILRDLSFTVKKGGVTGFLGANGAGKTTTMDIICGCQGFESGRVFIDGFDILKEPLAARRQLGYLPDVPPLHPHLSVLESLEHAGRFHGLKGEDLRKKTAGVLELLELGGVRGHLTSALSKGFRQRLGLAQALIHRPGVLVLDEPADGLDPAQLQGLRTLIRDLGKDCTVFLSSHLLGEVQAVCDELIIIHEGSILGQGSLQHLSRSLSMQKVVRLRVCQDAPGFLRELAGMDHLEESRLISPERGELRLTIRHEEAREVVDQVVRRAVNGPWGLYSLEPLENLEDIFLNFTSTRKADLPEAGSKKP